MSCCVSDDDLQCDQICVVLESIFLVCMDLCNYPIAIAVSVNQLSAGQWAESL